MSGDILDGFFACGGRPGSLFTMGEDLAATAAEHRCHFIAAAHACLPVWPEPTRPAWGWWLSAFKLPILHGGMDSSSHPDREMQVRLREIAEGVGWEPSPLAGTYVLAVSGSEEQDAGDVDLESVFLDHVMLRGSPWPVVVATGAVRQVVCLLSPFDSRNWAAIESWMRAGACYIQIEGSAGRRTVVGTVEAFKRPCDWDVWTGVDEACDIVEGDALELAQGSGLAARLIEQLSLEPLRNTKVVFVGLSTVREAASSV